MSLTEKWEEDLLEDDEKDPVAAYLLADDFDWRLLSVSSDSNYKPRIFLEIKIDDLYAGREEEFTQDVYRVCQMNLPEFENIEFDLLYIDKEEDKGVRKDYWLPIEPKNGQHIGNFLNLMWGSYIKYQFGADEKWEYNEVVSVLDKEDVQ